MRTTTGGQLGDAVRCDARQLLAAAKPDGKTIDFEKLTVDRDVSASLARAVVQADGILADAIPPSLRLGRDFRDALRTLHYLTQTNPEE